MIRRCDEDFPGTTNIHWKHFIDCIVDIGASLAYHGFKKIVFLNGHGSNAPNLDLAARRGLPSFARCRSRRAATTTGWRRACRCRGARARRRPPAVACTAPRRQVGDAAECIACSWWHLLTVDPEFLPGWRESRFPGGIAHACELRAAAAAGDVPPGREADGVARLIVEAWTRTTCARSGSWTARSPTTGTDPTSATPTCSATGRVRRSPGPASYSDSGVLGQATLATREKGRRAVEEAARQLARMLAEFRALPQPPRGDHHGVAPSMPMPWGQGTAPAARGGVHGAPEAGR